MIFPAFVRSNVPLASMTTYRVGGKTAHLARPQSMADLRSLADICSEHGLRPLMIGNGSNLLIADSGFDGIAISLCDMASQLSYDGVRVKAGAAVLLPQMSRRLAAAAVTGFEWAVGVPGSVGGAVRMNAGGHGSDIAASLLEARVFDITTKAEEWVSAEKLGLRFRGSALTDNEIVVEAHFEFGHGDRERSEAEINEIVRWRREHQPGGQNAGSVFVNPIPGELSAGELIDRVGLRGLAMGTATVSSKHANFIQGSVGGSAKDVRDLIEFVRTKVQAETGFLLRSEVRLVGFEGETDGHKP